MGIDIERSGFGLTVCWHGSAWFLSAADGLPLVRPARVTTSKEAVFTEAMATQNRGPVLRVGEFCDIPPPIFIYLARRYFKRGQKNSICIVKRPIPCHNISLVLLLVTAFSSTIPLLALFDMRRLSNRHANRRLCIAFLLVLAVVAFLRSWRQVALELPSSNGDVSISTSGGEIENSACEWQQGGPQLYMLQHTKKHPKGENTRSKQ